MSLKRHRQVLDKMIFQKQTLERILKDVRRAKKTAAEFLKNQTTALKAAQDIAKIVQHKAHERIAGVVTKCLRAVFPEPYEFKIIFETKRGKTDARMVFMDGDKERSPQDGVGGSVLDVASFALRLACLGLTKPPRRKVVFIDEGFVGVSTLQDNKERLRNLLTVLAEELGMQIIQVTHDEGLKAGTIVEI